MKQTLTSARRPLEALIHVIGWGIMFGFPFFFVERENGNINWMAYVRHSAVPLSFPEPEQEVYYLQYSPVVCHRSDAASLAESDIRPFLCSQAPVGSSSGMAVLCQRYAEPRFHHRTECRNTYECPMDASGSSPQGGRTESFGSRAEESAEPTESAFSAQHIEQYLCIDCFRYGQSTTGCAGTK